MDIIAATATSSLPFSTLSCTNVRKESQPEPTPYPPFTVNKFSKLLHGLQLQHTVDMNGTLHTTKDLPESVYTETAKPDSQAKEHSNIQHSIVFKIQ
jgi:hypothetical protein